MMDVIGEKRELLDGVGGLFDVVIISIACIYSKSDLVNYYLF